MKEEKNQRKWFDVIVVVFVSVISVIIVSALSEMYPMFPYYWFGILIPIGVLLITVYLMWTHQLRKDRMKEWIAGIGGLLLISFSALLGGKGAGGVYLILALIGFAILMLGLRRTFRE